MFYAKEIQTHMAIFQGVEADIQEMSAIQEDFRCFLEMITR